MSDKVTPKPINLVGRRKEVEPEDREILNPAEMMYDTFEKVCAGEVPLDESIAAAVQVPTRPQDGSEGGFRIGKANSPLVSMSEVSISHLLDARDSLITAYGQVSQDIRLSSLLDGCIRKVDASIKNLGGEIEDFDPQKYASGLGAVPRGGLLDNAKKVVANTQALYSLHRIEKIFAGPDKHSNRPGVAITIAGERNGKMFKVLGKVVAKSDFNGTEALDYVKDGGKGLLSVKEPRRGVWVDITKEFDIAWTLEKEPEGT